MEDDIILFLNIFLLVVSAIFVAMLMSSGHFILGMLFLSLLLTVIHHKIENE